MTDFSLLARAGNFSPQVAAFYTARAGGVSRGSYESLNLGDRVDDEPAAVAENRARLRAALGCGVVYMRQTHSTRVELISAVPEQPPNCDGLVTSLRGLALAVLTADCLPLLLAAEDGTAVAAVHCGWRGLAAGIVENALKLMRERSAAAITAWTGPCIGRESYEVGAELIGEFASETAGARAFFTPRAGGRYLCDLAGLCREILRLNGVERVCSSPLDTCACPGFFSYRRDRITGRQASVILIK